jgi:hypothetical protein
MSLYERPVLNQIRCELGKGVMVYLNLPEPEGVIDYILIVISQ